MTELMLAQNTDCLKVIMSKYFLKEEKPVHVSQTTSCISESSPLPAPKLQQASSVITDLKKSVLTKVSLFMMMMLKLK